MIQTIIGVVLFLVGAGLAYAGTQKSKRLAVLKETPTVACREVAGLTGSMVEVVGQSIAGPQGRLTSPITSQSCIWHRVRVTEVYYERDSNGNQTTNRQILTDDQTDPSFGVQDGSGRVLIDARGASVDDAEQTTSNSNFKVGTNTGFQLNINGLNLRPNSKIEQDEWILREGTTLFVSGEASTGDHGPQLVKPNGRELLISTRDEAAIGKAATQSRLLYFGAAGVAIFIGLIVLASLL